MIFLDTTVLVAGIDASDELHDDGKVVLGALAEGALPPALTTDFVLDETLTILTRRGATASNIARVVDSVLLSPLVSVAYVDEGLFREALSVFTKYGGLSFTDAATLAVMNKYKVKEIYSHDSDFDLKGIIRRERP